MPDQKKKNIIAVSIIVLAVVLYAVGMLVLPDVIAIQMNIDGEAGNTAAKPLGLLIPLGISTIFSLFYLKGESKYLIGAAVGLLCYALTFIMNL